MARPPRTYLSIWNSIKQSHLQGKSCRVAVIPELQARVIKAVKKEKDIDLAYKLELAERGQTAKLVVEKTASVISFSLKIYGISLEDL